MNEYDKARQSNAGFLDSDKLRAAFTLYGWSQNQVADELGISSQRLSQIMTEGRCRRDKAESIAQVLNIDVNLFYRDWDCVNAFASKYNPDLYTGFVRQFFAICKARDESAMQVLDSIKCCRHNLKGWKAGIHPQHRTLVKLAEHFNVPVSYFYMEEGETYEP